MEDSVSVLKCSCKVSVLHLCHHPVSNIVKRIFRVSGLCCYKSSRSSTLFYTALVILAFLNPCLTMSEEERMWSYADMIHLQLNFFTIHLHVSVWIMSAWQPLVRCFATAWLYHSKNPLLSLFGPLSNLGTLPILPEHSWLWYTTTIVTHVPK